MTLEELTDEAYLIATANALTERFNFKEFQEINTTKYAWEPFEYWTDSQLSSHIAQMADDITRAFKKVCTDV